MVTLAILSPLSLLRCLRSLPHYSTTPPAPPVKPTLHEGRRLDQDRHYAGSGPNRVSSSKEHTVEAESTRGIADK
jgi:hypothetical protein